MAQQFTEDAARWKTKFLDALEDQERQEKSFRNRINLLRRGLVSVSLAGDGLDPELDRELNRLRTALRKEDNEAGLEPVLEHIERSVLRLDADRDQDAKALIGALQSSIAQLQSAPLSRELRQEMHRYGKCIADRISDSRDQPLLIVEFLTLLRRAVREITLVPEDPQEAGFWRRLFFGGAPAAGVRAASTEAVSPTADGAGQAAPDNASVSARIDPAIDQPPSTPAPQNTDPLTPDQPTLDAATPLTVDVAQPGFSFIASHVEPVLLRILENIHVTQQSQGVSQRVRKSIAGGLNWYDFAAVLEDIAAIIASAIEQERTDFQGFLSEINESLEHVQAYVRTTHIHGDRVRAVEAKFDDAVRAEVESLHHTVTTASHIHELKQVVQGQLNAILAAVDTFQEDRRQQDAIFSADTRQLTERIESLERESRELQAHLAQQVDEAARDGLTGLPNRGAYDSRLRQLMALRPLQSRPFSLVVADVDLFKTVNDTFGHLAGDKVLKILAREINTNIRQSDFVARYGGEEFVIILQEADQDAARQVIEKLRLAISRIPFHFKETQIQITMSFGIAESQTGDTPDLLFERADQALYAAKRHGRNRCQVFSYTANPAAADAHPAAV